MLLLFVGGCDECGAGSPGGRRVRRRDRGKLAPAPRVGSARTARHACSSPWGGSRHGLVCDLHDGSPAGLRAATRAVAIACTLLASTSGEVAGNGGGAAARRHPLGREGVRPPCACAPGAQQFAHGPGVTCTVVRPCRPGPRVAGCAARGSPVTCSDGNASRALGGHPARRDASSNITTDQEGADRNWPGPLPHGLSNAEPWIGSNIDGVAVLGIDGCRVGRDAQAAGKARRPRVAQDVGMQVGRERWVSKAVAGPV